MSKLKITRRTTVGLAALVAAASMATACSSYADAEPHAVSADPVQIAAATTYAAPTATFSPDPAADDDLFIEALLAEGLPIRGIDEGTVTDAGRAVCDLLDLGYPVDDVLETVHDEAGLDYHDAGVFTGAAISAYCTEYTADAIAFAEATR